MDVHEAEVKTILTRSSGFLRTVCSHSLQPYRGCALGNSLCGVGCYVQHNWYVTRGQPWGSFVDARTNAAAVYTSQYEKEKTWARQHRNRFSIFLSSSSEPFQPAERKYRVTRSVLEAMVGLAPDELILQTHSHHVTDCIDLYPELSRRCDFRVHVSIETDIERFDGLPPPGSSVAKRLQAVEQLHAAGIRVFVTVAPLLPMRNPAGFFEKLAGICNGVVIDHYIEGDGSPDGSRTNRTPLPVAMERVAPGSSTLAYREEIVRVARQFLPGRVGINIPGFAGDFA